MMRKILSKIADAKKSIDIAMYNFTNSDLARAIIQARRRGVSVRIIVDKSTDENEENNHSQATDLLKNSKISSIFSLHHFQSIENRRFSIELMKICVWQMESTDAHLA